MSISLSLYDRFFSLPPPPQTLIVILSQAKLISKKELQTEKGKRGRKSATLFFL